jgi:hypothetical protein
LPITTATESNLKARQGKDTLNEFVQPPWKQPNALTADDLYYPETAFRDLLFEEGLEEQLLATCAGQKDSNSKPTPRRPSGEVAPDDVAVDVPSYSDSRVLLLDEHHNLGRTAEV